MANWIGGPKAQFFDRKGAPLAGGVLYAYKTGTRIPTNIYTNVADAEAETNGASSLTLDSRGEASIVVNAAVKLALHDADGNELWTVDNAGGAIDNTALYDENGLLVLKVISQSTSTTNLDVANSATGDPLPIAAEGDDSNVDLDIAPRSHVIVKDTGSTVGTVRLPELSSNGSNYIEYKAPSSITTTAVMDLPSRAGMSGEYLLSNGSDSLEWYLPSISLQYATAVDTLTSATASTEVTFDDNVPQSSQGVELLTVTLTPNDADNYLIVEAWVNHLARNTFTYADWTCLSLYQDSDTDPLGCYVGKILNVESEVSPPPYGYGHLMHATWRVRAGTASSTTLKIRSGTTLNMVDNFDLPNVMLIVYELPGTL